MISVNNIKFIPGFEGDFVLHDHEASYQHYDLRIQVPVDDVGINLESYRKRRADDSPEPNLLSSSDFGYDSVLMSFVLSDPLPTERQLSAATTESYPHSYLNFEGTIPEGNYGEGVITIYDSGKYILNEYSPDKIVADFRGNRLKGRYSLIKDASEQWQIVKMKKESGMVLGANIAINRDNYYITYDNNLISVFKQGKLLESVNVDDIPEHLVKELNSDNDYNKTRALETWLDEYTDGIKRSSLELISYIHDFSNLLKTANVLDFVHPGLNPEVWSVAGILRTRHRRLVLSRLVDILERERLYNYAKWIKNIFFIGSLTTYQYTRNSDADVHIVVDVPEFIKLETGGQATKEGVNDLLGVISKSVNLRDVVPLKQTHHAIEYYFDTDDKDYTKVTEGGVYDVVENSWLVPPTAIDVEFDPETVFANVIKDAEEIAKGLDIDFGGLDRGAANAELLVDTIRIFPPQKRTELRNKLDLKLGELENDIELITHKLDMLKDDKKENYDQRSEGNLRFKYLQRFGYIAALSKLNGLIEDHDLVEGDLPEIREIVKEI